MRVEASNHMAAFAKRNSTGAFTERSMAARRRLSPIGEVESVVSMVRGKDELIAVPGEQQEPGQAVVPTVVRAPELAELRGAEQAGLLEPGRSAEQEGD